MSPLLNAKRAAGLLLATAIGCSSVAEWEERPGEIELFASPLPPVAGEPITLGVKAKNVGPIEVFQGDTLIATFMNVELDELKTYDVVAASDKKPRAVSIAYDYRRLELAAAPFPSAAPPAQPSPVMTTEPEPEPPAATECPGLVDAPTGCSEEPTTPMRVRIVNNTTGPLTIYEAPPHVFDPAQCSMALRTLVNVGATQEFESTAGAVIQVVLDDTIQTVRRVRLPEVDVCQLVIDASE
jgi:hypothetical protein